jgi:hypothetical protein
MKMTSCKKLKRSKEEFKNKKYLLKNNKNKLPDKVKLRFKKEFNIMSELGETFNSSIPKTNLWIIILKINKKTLNESKDL